ncbi:E3L [Bat mastadenovirus WIV9]|uniref:E3L n=1 Tax=Bat mastadenovirus WIV9 TaxID=1788436 RepID=A0A163HIQ9_9ADEN|nr:E3L [Bat mastadenovirus WIV9]AMB43066.1 E3L [Bat mastadenovirus WIV9]
MRIKEYLSKMKLEACFSFLGLFTLGLICGYLQLPIPTTNPLKKIAINVNGEIWATEGTSVFLAPPKPLYNGTGGYYAWLKNGVSIGYSFDGKCFLPRCAVRNDGSLFLMNVKKEDGGRFEGQFLVDDKFQTKVEYLVKIMSTEELMSHMGGGPHWGPMSPEEELAVQLKPPSGPRQRRAAIDATADYQVLAITFFFGAILFFCMVIIVCCYRWRVGRLHQLYGSTALLIGGAKAQTPMAEETWEEWVAELPWWDWLSIALVAVAAVCTIIVVAYVLWKYPPRCRRGGKNLWITTPLLLLCVAAPAFTAKTYQIPDYYQVEEGGEVMFDLDNGSRFQEMNWTKLIGNQEYAVAYANETYVRLDFEDRNETGISMAGIYINGSVKIMNISKEAEGTYQANLYLNGNHSYQIFMLGVVYHLKMPVITVERLNTSQCKLLCGCSGENVTLEAIVGNTTTKLKYSWQVLNSDDVRFLRCTANRNNNKRTTLVSVHEPCRAEYIIHKVVYTNDELLWMLLSLVLMILAAGIWYCVDGIRMHLRARDAMAIPLLTVMLLTPAQAAFTTTNFNLRVGENATLQLNETNATWFLETAAPTINYRHIHNFSNLSDVCTEVQMKNNSIHLLGVKPTLRTLTAKASNFTHYFNFNISDLQRSSNQSSNYWRDYWWVYLVACLVLFLLVLICVICTHKIRMRNRNAWMLGPLVLLMICDASFCYKLPALDERNTICRYDSIGSWVRYESVSVVMGGTFTLTLQCGKPHKIVRWYANDGAINIQFLEFNNGTFSDMPYVLSVLCHSYVYSMDSFSCELKSDLNSIIASAETHDNKSDLETFYFNYGISTPEQVILADVGDTVILHCFIGPSWQSSDTNMVIWKFNDQCLGYYSNGGVNSESFSNFYSIDKTEFSLTIEVNKSSIFGRYECKTQIKPSKEKHAEIKQYFYNLQPKTLFSTAPAFDHVGNADKHESTETNNLPWWGAMLIGIVLIAAILLIGSAVINKMTNRTQKVFLLSPLILTACIPAADCDNLVKKASFSISITQNVSAMTGEDLLLNPFAEFETIVWGKLKSAESNKFSKIAAVTEEGSSKYTMNFQELFFSVVDMFINGSLKIHKLTSENSGIYVQDIKKNNGFGATIYINVTVKPKPYSFPKMIFINITDQTTVTVTTARNHWWVITVAVLTLLLFLGIGIKFYVDNNLGLPPPYYPPKKPIYTNHLLLTACLCLLLPTTIASPNCKVFNQHLYGLSNQSLLLNASVDVSSLFKYRWNKVISNNAKQLIVQNQTSIQYFLKHNFQLLNNGSLLIKNSSRADSGTYQLSCIASTGKSTEAIVVVDILDKCRPPKMQLTVELFGDFCRTKVFCNSTTSNTIKFPEPNPKEVDFNIQSKTNTYWIYPNQTSPYFVSCNCTNLYSSAHSMVDLKRECDEARHAYHLLIHPQTYISMHHLWWIYGLMLFLAGLAAAAWWWWHKHHKRPDKPNGLKDSAEEKPALKDLAEIV